MQKVFMFPGQGSQYVGMANDLFEEFQLAKDIFNQANDILGYDLSTILFNGPKELLQQTKYTQPAIFIHSIIINNFLKSKNIFPSAVAGHSLGEYSALVSAEVLTFEEALKIVKVRSSEMSKAGKNNPGTMAAIIGANNEQLEKICNQTGIVTPANLNAPGQVVISGEIDAIFKAIETAKHIGIRRALPLNVSGAFHSPLMKPARLPLNDILNSVNFMDAKVPIYQNVSAKPTQNGDKIKSNILEQLENPVRWEEIISNMYNDGFSSFIEIGPGKVLQGLNKRILLKHESIGIDNKDQVKSYV